MSARLMVLGVAQAKGQAHGYMIYRELLSWRVETWTKVRPGSIYHALTQLAKEGLLQVKGTTASKTAPAKTTYAITAAGKAELASLVEKALLTYDQELFAAGLAFMHVLPRQQVIELAKQRLAMYESTVSFMHELPREADPKTPATHPEILDSWTAQFDVTAQWMKQFIAHLEQGRYVFAEEHR